MARHSKEYAQQKAQELKNKLEEAFEGSEWNTRVWQNMGWHWEAYAGTISVSQGISTNNYHCLIDSDLTDKKPMGGLSAWTPRKNWAETPEEAVRLCVEAAEKYVNNLNQVIELNKSVIDTNYNPNTPGRP